MVAAAVAQRGLTAVYEMYNEPDGNWFFAGSWNDYLAMYAAGAAGVQAAGDPKAQVVGPAAAFIDEKNLNAFLAYVKQHSLRLDALSVHAYCPLDCVQGRLAQTKAILDANGFTATPIHLNEVNTMTSANVHNHFQMGVAIFNMAAALAGDARIGQVNFAQFMDSGAGDNWGTISADGHKKAAYNAWQLYNAMPVGSVSLSVSGGADSGLRGLAASNSTCVMAAVWDAVNVDHAVKLTFQALSFPAGVAVLYRIDAQHSSFYDNPASEDLQPLQREAVSAYAYSTQLSLPANGLLFLCLSSSTSGCVF